MVFDDQTRPLRDECLVCKRKFCGKCTVPASSDEKFICLACLPYSRRSDKTDLRNEVKLLSDDKIRSGERLARKILPTILTIHLHKITRSILVQTRLEVAAFGNFLSGLFGMGVPEAVSSLLPVACKILQAQMIHKVKPFVFSQKLAMSLNGRHSDLTQTTSVLMSQSYANDVVDKFSSISLQISRQERGIGCDGRFRIIYLLGDDVSDASSITNGLLAQFARHDADKFDVRFILNFEVNLDELHPNACYLKGLEEAGRVAMFENNRDVPSYIQTCDVDILLDLSGGQYDEVLRERPAVLNLAISENRQFMFYPRELVDYTIGSKGTFWSPSSGLQAKHIAVGFGLTFPNDLCFVDHSNRDRKHFKFRPGATLFCYPSSLVHVTKNHFFLWLELLTRVDGSDLILIREPYEMYHEIKHWVMEYSAQQPFDIHRVMFLPPFSNHQDRWAMLRHADLFLNSSGGCDALILMKPVLCFNREDSDFLSHLACDMMLAVGLDLFAVNNNQEFLKRGETFAKSLSAQKSVQQHLKNHNTENPDKWIRGLETAIQSGVLQKNSSCGDCSKLVDIDVFDLLKMPVFLDEDETIRNRVLDEILKKKGPMSEV